MAQFDPSSVLRRVPQRRNTLIDFSPVSLPDLETPSTGALVAALANDSINTAVQGYLDSKKLDLDNQFRIETLREQNKYRDEQLRIKQNEAQNKIDRDEDKETMGLLKNVSIYDTDSIQKLIDNIKDFDQQKLLLNQYQALKPSIDEANAYENKFGDLTIREVNATEEGRKEYSKYRNNPIFKTNFLGARASVHTQSEKESYKKEKSYYAFVANEEQGLAKFLRDFDVKEKDINTIVGLVKNLPKDQGNRTIQNLLDKNLTEKGFTGDAKQEKLKDIMQAFIELQSYASFVQIGEKFGIVPSPDTQKNVEDLYKETEKKMQKKKESNQGDVEEPEPVDLESEISIKDFLSLINNPNNIPPAFFSEIEDYFKRNLKGSSEISPSIYNTKELQMIFKNAGIIK